jgi:hypothetical protein
LVKPPRDKVAIVDALRTHVPPSVIVTVWPEPTAPALVHVPENAPPRVTVGDAGTLIPDGKVTVIIEFEVNAPFGDDVNPTFQEVELLATGVVGEKDTFVGPVETAAIVTSPPGLPALAVDVSEDVETRKPVPSNVVEPGFVKPPRVNVAVVERANEHVPLREMVTV